VPSRWWMSGSNRCSYVAMKRWAKERVEKASRTLLPSWFAQEPPRQSRPRGERKDGSDVTLNTVRNRGSRPNPRRFATRRGHRSR
jgi:hypothetical protein